MRILRAMVVVLAVSSPIGLRSRPAAAQAPAGDSAKLAAATADAVRIGRRDPAGEAIARMKIAEMLMLTDPPAAAAMVEAARAASIRAEGADGPMVALADYRLTLIRALGGDRVGQLRPMAAAAHRIAAAARTPEHRTLAGQSLIVAASFTQNSGEPALTDALRDAGIAMLGRSDLAETTDLAEAFRVVGDNYIFQNRPAEALEWSDRAVKLYERIDPRNSALVLALARRGSAYFRLSRYPEALADLRRAVAQSDGETADPTVPVYALRALGNYYWRLAEHDLALPLLKRALVAAEKLPAGFPYAGGLSRDIMLTLIDADRLEDARAYADDTARRTRATMGENGYEYASALLVLARIDVAEQAHDDAARRIDQAEAIFARGVAADNARRFELLAARGALLVATGKATEGAGYFDRARATIAHFPPDDADRIDMAEGSAAARLIGDRTSPEGWTAARAAADGLTVRIVRQVSGVGALDTAKGRSDRVFGTALDTAWARGWGLAGP